MKKIIIPLILIMFLLSGCGISGIFNLNDFVIPDDLEFMQLVEELDTPEKICNYMSENFDYEYYEFRVLDPFMLWQIKKGDCNDFATFASFIANYHGYETYQMVIWWKYYSLEHMICIYKENGKYNYSSDYSYYEINVNSFLEIVNMLNATVEKYQVYDYNMNIIETISL